MKTILIILLLALSFTVGVRVGGILSVQVLKDDGTVCAEVK